jgi:hypothetical protein
MTVMVALYLRLPELLVKVKMNVTLVSVVTDFLPPLIDTEPTPLSIDADVALLSVQIRVPNPPVKRLSGLAVRDPTGKDDAGGDP